jgi:hypothetical protein
VAVKSGIIYFATPKDIRLTVKPMLVARKTKNGKEAPNGKEKRIRILKSQKSPRQHTRVVRPTYRLDWDCA